MRVLTSLVTDNEFFTSERQGELLLVREKAHFARHASDLQKIDTFFEHMEIIARTDLVKAVVFLGAAQKGGGEDTVAFFRTALASRREDYVLQRLFNLVNNYVAILAGLNKITVHADSGRISIFHLGVSMACDFRLVDQSAVFENSFAELGTIPKGGCGYFMARMLGTIKTAEVLQWGKFTAEEALNLGIVDKVVPLARLEETAVATAQAYLKGQVSTLLAIRKLLKSDVNELRRSLELEDLLILNRVNSPDFRSVLDQRQAAKAPAAG